MKPRNQKVYNIIFLVAKFAVTTEMPTSSCPRRFLSGRKAPACNSSRVIRTVTRYNSSVGYLNCYTLPLLPLQETSPFH